MKNQVSNPRKVKHGSFVTALNKTSKKLVKHIQETQNILFGLNCDSIRTLAYI